MKARHIIAKDRWKWSLIIAGCPLIGIFIYASFRNLLREKEYRFFSDDFIRKYLT